MSALAQSGHHNRAETMLGVLLRIVAGNAQIFFPGRRAVKEQLRAQGIRVTLVKHADTWPSSPTSATTRPTSTGASGPTASPRLKTLWWSVRSTSSRHYFPGFPQMKIARLTNLSRPVSALAYLLLVSVWGLPSRGLPMADSKRGGSACSSRCWRSSASI